MMVIVHEIALLLGCLAFLVNGRRVHSSRHEAESQRVLKRINTAPSQEPQAELNDLTGQERPLKALSMLLAAHNPAFRNHRRLRVSGRSLALQAPGQLLRLHGGAADVSDAFMEKSVQAQQLSSSLLAEATHKVTALRKQLASGETIPELGKQAEEIIDDALDKFSAQSPEAEFSELYQAAAEGLRKAIMTSLEPAFAQQICLFKGIAMEQFLNQISSKSGDSGQALAKAEAWFVREAGASLPSSMQWLLKVERSGLASAMRTIIIQRKKEESVTASASPQMQTALTYLQMQQQQMQELQSQYIGGQGGKWKVAAAHRPPDMNINLSAKYEPGGACKLNIYMLPDEGASILGPYGFTKGVGPANLGLNFNINI